MSATVDTNILVYASDQSSPLHPQALDCLEALRNGSALVYLLWPVIMGYLRITTHPAIFSSPLSAAEATDNIDGLLALPHIRTAGEASGFWQDYKPLSGIVLPRGNLVPDTHIAALMHHHGVSTIWTRDSDFKKFPGITTRNPFAH